MQTMYDVLWRLVFQTYCRDGLEELGVLQQKHYPIIIHQNTNKNYIGRFLWTEDGVLLNALC